MPDEVARLVAAVPGWSDEQVAREVEHYVRRVEAERESRRMPNGRGRKGAPEIVPVRRALGGGSLPGPPTPEEQP